MKDANSWLGSVSDMMAGLMMIFLLIAVALMLDVREDKERAIEEKREAEQRAEKYLHQGETIRKITAAYKDLQEALYADLMAEFQGDLPKWNASIEKDSTVRFNSPEVLFETQKSLLQDKFKEILSDFFPRYVRILTTPKYIDNIEEVRVEGHTSSEWEGATSFADRYLNNARLSQERALEVVRYAYRLDSVTSQRDWLTKAIRANGLSFARPILDRQGAEDQGRSRRVEFRVFTKTKEQILRIIEVSDKQQQDQK